MQYVAVWAAKRKSSTIINGSGKSKNPKVEALVNEIINDGGAETGSSTIQLPDMLPPPHAVSTHESGEYITDTESEDSTDGGNELPQPPPEVIEEVFSSMLEAMQRTKEEIIGWCSDEDEDVEEEFVQRNPKLVLLPSAAKELYNIFKILHCQFLRHGKYEKRNDLVFLLNEMLKRTFNTQEN